MQRGEALFSEGEKHVPLPRQRNPRPPAGQQGGANRLFKIFQRLRNGWLGQAKAVGGVLQAAGADNLHKGGEVAELDQARGLAFHFRN